MNSQQVVFLSHSGLDHKLANALSRRIENELHRRYQLNVRVFNTSDPEYRFKELKEVLGDGTNWVIEGRRYEEELRDYLRKHLLASQAYILLVTWQSFAANSGWIEFEMELASKEARKRGLIFIPCVTGGASLRMLPKLASVFQGFEIESEDGFRKFLGVMSQILKKP